MKLYHIKVNIGCNHILELSKMAIEPNKLGRIDKGLLDFDFENTTLLNEENTERIQSANTKDSKEKKTTFNVGTDPALLSFEKNSTSPKGTSPKSL